jgi:hypothetical protein
LVGLFYGMEEVSYLYSICIVGHVRAERFLLITSKDLVIPYHDIQYSTTWWGVDWYKYKHKQIRLGFTILTSSYDTLPTLFHSRVYAKDQYVTTYDDVKMVKPNRTFWTAKISKSLLTDILQKSSYHNCFVHACVRVCVRACVRYGL